MPERSEQGSGERLRGHGSVSILQRYERDGSGGG